MTVIVLLVTGLIGLILLVPSLSRWPGLAATGLSKNIGIGGLDRVAEFTIILFWG